MDKVTDVVIIGFGGAGAPAAIEAAEAGAEVLVLEKMRKPGGAAGMAAGIVFAAGTSVQRAAGIDDSADEMYEYLMKTGDGMRDPDAIRVLADKAGEAVEWLIGLGADFPPEGVFTCCCARGNAHIISPKPRCHHFRPRRGESTYTGMRLWSLLEKAAKDRNVEIMLETTATQLVTNANNEVIGVKAISSGEDILIRARRAVVLADGGFARNPEMLKQYVANAPYIASGQITLSSHPGQTGDGIRMGMAVGAALCGMQSALANAAPALPVGEPSPFSPEPRFPSIYVNRGGLRFVNEDAGRSTISHAIDKQDSIAFQIFDDVARQGGNLPEAKLRQHVSAPTIDELAAKLGIDAEGLESTVKQWNRHAESGEDPEFGKTGPTVGLIRTPPFWGGLLKRSLVANHGGLKTNAEAQVLHVLDGKPIPRLYAAGQTTGGRVGWSLPSSGTSFANCFVFGRIAGENAARENPLEE